MTLVKFLSRNAVTIAQHATGKNLYLYVTKRKILRSFRRSHRPSVSWENDASHATTVNCRDT
jgi:hypothetical protein